MKYLFEINHVASACKLCKMTNNFLKLYPLFNACYKFYILHLRLSISKCYYIVIKNIYDLFFKKQIYILKIKFIL